MPTLRNALSDKELDKAIFTETFKGLTGYGTYKDLRKLLVEWKKRKIKRDNQ